MGWDGVGWGGVGWDGVSGKQGAGKRQRYKLCLMAFLLIRNFITFPRSETSFLYTRVCVRA